MAWGAALQAAWGWGGDANGGVSAPSLAAAARETVRALAHPAARGELASRPAALAMLRGIHLVRGDVEVHPRRASSTILQEINGIRLVVLVPRGVDNAHVVLPIDIHILIHEFQGGHLPLSVELVILVSPLPVELLRRCP